MDEDIRKFVEAGGRVAFDFSCLYSPNYDRVPGREIQRAIDEHVTKINESEDE